MISTQNGARRRILGALAKEGLMTTEELAARTDLTAKQVRDNCAAARAEGLLTNERDDITGHLAYKITAEGRKRIGDQSAADKPTDNAGDPPPSPADSDPHASIATDAIVVDLSFRVDPATYPFPFPFPADEPLTDDPDATPNGALYALCRAGDDHMSAWPLHAMPIDAAKQLAIDDASTINGEVVLYRCTPVGRAVPRFVFEEHEQ